MSTYTGKVSTIEGIGKAVEKELQKLGIATIRDLIFYLPYRFDDFTHIYAISDLKAQCIGTVRGTVKLLQSRRSWRTKKIVTEALISDESGSIKAIWFNQPFIVKNLSVGDNVSMSGRTSDNYYDLQLISPSYEKVISDKETLHTGRLVPVYSLTAKLHQKQFRKFIKTALHSYHSALVEYVPDAILRSEDLPLIADALQAMHFPNTMDDARRAQSRFTFEGLFFLQLCNLIARKHIAQFSAHPIPFDKKTTREFVESLPFTLTKSQKQAAWEIVQDIKKNSPMNRLLEGDVGAGKTVVAALAMLNTVQAGYQCAVMAPTEILARQHYQTFCRLFERFEVSIALMTSQNQESNIKNKESEIKNQELHAAIANSDIDIIVGTHALIQKKIMFQNLALAVIDEQHRFGVAQRKMICKKNKNGVMPHLLSMTATPIPRSLALTVYGDLDLSLLQGVPHGRKRVITKIVPQEYREWVYDFIKKEIKEGHQAFIICPIIDPSDTLGVRSVSEESKRLQKGELSSVRLGILHGKMKQKEKEQIMESMVAGEIDVLLSTSVVEVGIDLPRATIMLIEGAERFGLAQLHQFRGRVGRSSWQSYCFLLPTEATKENRIRLKAMVASNDGFALAEKDLELRGEGDVFGERQSGVPALTLASLTNAELIKKTRSYAEQYLPQLDKFPELAQRVETLQHDAHFE